LEKDAASFGIARDDSSMSAPPSELSRTSAPRRELSAIAARVSEPSPTSAPESEPLVTSSPPTALGAMAGFGYVPLRSPPAPPEAPGFEASWVTCACSAVTFFCSFFSFEAVLRGFAWEPYQPGRAPSVRR
jgi:hypothetical protein